MFFKVVMQTCKIVVSDDRLYPNVPYVESPHTQLWYIVDQFMVIDFYADDASDDSPLNVVIKQHKIVSTS